MKASRTHGEVIAIFESEFSPLLGKFAVYTLGIQEARQSKDEHVWKPGCYVFWSPKYGVLKVGRSFSNSRKRALEHIQDDTGGLMRDLDKADDARLILFNLKREEDRHWAAAVEVYLEVKLKPYIRSRRTG